MNLKTLDCFLTQLSPNEQKYKSGYVHNWDSLDKVMLNGREVGIIRLVSTSRSGSDSDYPDYFADSMSQDGSSLPSAQPHITIKRNSRFNPVPEHIHSYIEINYVYSGTCPQVIDGTPVTLEKNQVLLIDTNCPHSIPALGENDIMISLVVQKEYLRGHIFSQFSKDSILSHFFINAINEQTNHDHYLLFHSENDRRIPLFFRELFCECYDPSINSSDIIMHLFYAIMAELINVYENDLTKETPFAEQTPIIPMIRYIEKNFRTCTQESVAEFFHISANYVSTLLKKNTGMTYIQLIQTKKLKYAADLLLNTNLPVTETANLAGYENVSFFYKKFQARFGCSPKEYREKAYSSPRFIQ